MSRASVWPRSDAPRTAFPSRHLVELNHDALIVRYGGSLGVRDNNLLQFALARPLNVLLFSERTPTDLFCDAAAAFA